MRAGRAALALVSAFTFITAASCSGDDPPQKGQLVIAFQSDMEVPKDVEAMRVLVKSFGVTLLDNTYPLGSGAERTQLPATLTIVANDDPSTPVSIQLIALAGSKAHVVRKAITTVPDKRTALLHMPIQFLCWDEVTVTEDDTGVTASDKTCGEQTCVAGACKDPTIDSATLGNYKAAEVFGGASGPGTLGACLDVLACFEKGAEVPVDLGDCSVALPGPLETTNIGLVVPPGGQGICGAGACIVPLDRDALLGWSESGGRAVLPAAVCNKLGSSVTAVAVTSSCTGKTPGIPTCGPWSSVSGLPGAEDASPPTKLDGGPSGEDASGLDGGVTPNVCAGQPDGDYCGSELAPPAIPSTLYSCSGGKLIVGTPCPGGCTPGGGKGSCSGGKPDAGTDSGGIGPGPAAELGKKCQADAQCGKLKCVRHDAVSFASGGPANGVCTWPCAIGNNVCGTIKTGAICHAFSPPNGDAYCLEGCNPQAAAGVNCGGRDKDMACTMLIDIASQTPAPACLPLCNTKAECGTLSCHPDGLCRGADPSPTAIGQNCGVDAGPGVCGAGICTPYISPEAGFVTEACTEPCTLGAIGSCRYQPGVSPNPDHGCFEPADPSSPTPGNLGLCAQLCGCKTFQVNCADPAFHCLPFPAGTSTVYTTDWDGYCGPPTGTSSPGGC